MISFNGPRNWSPVSVDGRNPAKSPVEVGSLSHQFTYFLWHPRWKTRRISEPSTRIFPTENHDKLQLNPKSWCDSSGDFRRLVIYALNSPPKKNMLHCWRNIFTPWKINDWNPTNHLFRKEHDLNETSMMKCSMLILRFVTFNSHRIHVWNIYLHSTIKINHSCR